MRITGLASGLDIDGIVSETMQPYKLQVTNKEKEKALLELKQSMYQDIIQSGQDFYDKYFSLTAKNSLALSSTYATTKFVSSNENAVSVKGLAGAEKDNYTVSVKQLAQSASTTVTSNDLTEGQTITITMDGKSETFTLKGSSQSEMAKNLNSELSEKGFSITAKYSDFADNGNGGLKLQTSSIGEDISFQIKVGNNAEEIVRGQDAIVDITNSNGDTKHYKGSSNTVTLDNVQFAFNSVTVGSNGVDNPISVNGTTDVSDLKDTIINFVNDYNKLIEDLNTKLSEKRDKSYMPLTDDERAEMSDSQIELWENKVKTGLFRNDSDLTRIVNSMKSAMQSMISSTGLKLEDIGIVPVNNYGTKNGTFTIDEEKLTQALENNIEGVKELFTAPQQTTNLNGGVSYQSGGIITSLSDTFKNEFVLSSQSSLIKKAGTKNSSINSTITAELKKKQETINKMKSALTTRENNLYNKYSKLETAMSKLAAQQSWLMQQFSY